MRQDRHALACRRASWPRTILAILSHLPGVRAAYGEGGRRACEWATDTLAAAGPRRYGLRMLLRT